MGWLANAFTWWNGATWGTSIVARRRFNEVGRDDWGNVYYQNQVLGITPRAVFGSAY